MSARALAVIAVGLVGACAGLKQADDVPANPGRDGGGGTAEGGSTISADGEAPAEDAGPPPIDFECDNDSWTKPAKARAECEPRQVRLLEEDVVDIRGISIARTPAGRVGIVYNDELWADEGEMHLQHFVPTSPSFSPALLSRAQPLSHAGLSSRIAASGPDVLHVLAHDVSDQAAGDVVLTQLSNGTAPFTEPEPIFLSVADPTELALAADSSGNAYAVARLATDLAGTTAKVAARQRPLSGPIADLPDVAVALAAQGAPAVGATSLHVDKAGVLHLLYHHCENAGESWPRYHVLEAGDFSFRKTLDNKIPDGIAGYGARIAVSGTRKYAAYFFRKTDSATADLRVATWISKDDTPSIEIVDQAIPAADPLRPRYRVAMAVDKYGLVHLAVVRPNDDGMRGHLAYRRQTRALGGATKWLLDVVDADVLGDDQDGEVDLVVDENARPHIGYYSGKDRNVYYATRYDR